MKGTWIAITRDKYFEKFKEKRDQLTCFASCTDADYVFTEWGLRGTDTPYIKAIDQLCYDESGYHEWEYRYYYWARV